MKPMKALIARSSPVLLGAVKGLATEREAKSLSCPSLCPTLLPSHLELPFAWKRRSEKGSSTVGEVSRLTDRKVFASSWVSESSLLPLGQVWVHPVKSGWQKSKGVKDI